LFTKAEFVKESLEFKKKLAQSQSFDEILKLWRSTSFAYVLDSSDPLSEEYLNEVMSIYEGLTFGQYELANEMTSTRQSPEDFEIGYPWISKHFGQIAQEHSKVIQAFREFHKQDLSIKRIIEFGAGWGNLAIPAAKAGASITTVDIDEGFLNRILRASARENLAINCIHGDFLTVAQNITERYDAVVFQASFHHCIEFSKLVTIIRDNVLADNGCILFFSEPIYRNLPFPWGLRYDGESIWAITCNKWLELGFERNFFVKFMLSKGFLLSQVDPVEGFVGEGWCARVASLPMPFEEMLLPDWCDSTFYGSAHARGFGRFCRSESILPGLAGGHFSRYLLTFRNYSFNPIRFHVEGSQTSHFELAGGAELTISIEAISEKVRILSDIYVPDVEQKNGDLRTLGVCLAEVTMI